MAFLNKADYYTQVRQLRLEQMTENIDAVFTQASSEAIAVIKGYLYTLYNTTTIFEATGTNRDALVLLHCKNIAIYLLHQRLPAAMIPAHVQKNYDDTLAYMERVASGKIAVDLPRKEKDTDGDGVNDSNESVFIWGSGVKARSH